MLPQMMPMPWTLLFIVLFISFFSISFIFFTQHMSTSTPKPLKMKTNSMKINW